MSLAKASCAYLTRQTSFKFQPEMGEYNCTQCNKTFRSERALKFHTENHADEKSDKEWSARRERSRSRVRELSASRESIEADAYKAGERGGRATSRRNLGLDTGVKNSLASLDQKTKTCMEPGKIWNIFSYMVLALIFLLLFDQS